MQLCERDRYPLDVDYQQKMSHWKIGQVGHFCKLGRPFFVARIVHAVQAKYTYLRWGISQLKSVIYCGDISRKSPLPAANPLQITIDDEISHT